MCISLLALGAFVLVSVSAGTTCPQGNIVYKPANSQPFYWPSSWRENQTAPELQAGQVCSWTVTIPEGFYVKLIINGKTSDSLSRFQMIDSAGNFIQTTEEGMQPYYFPAAKLTIALSIQATATFAFKIVWAPMPKFIVGGTGVDRGVHVVNVADLAQGGYYSAHTFMSVLPFPTNPNDAFALRSVLVFNGYQANARYATNLFQIFQNHQQWVSSEAVMYLVNLESRNSTDKVVLQEYGYTRDIQQYVELRCDDGGASCTATVDAGSQKSALLDINGVNRTLTNVEMDPTSFVDIYFGPQRPDDFHYSYNGTAIQTLLPLRFPSSITQYIISSGKAVFHFAN